MNSKYTFHLLHLDSVTQIEFILTDVMALALKSSARILYLLYRFICVVCWLLRFDVSHLVRILHNCSYLKHFSLKRLPSQIYGRIEVNRKEQEIF